MPENVEDACYIFPKPKVTSTSSNDCLNNSSKTKDIHLNHKKLSSLIIKDWRAENIHIEGLGPENLACFVKKITQNTKSTIKIVANYFSV